MTAAPLFAPVLPPGTRPARPTQGEGASDVAGLFALLLAGTQPVQADVTPGAGPSTRPAPAVAPAPLGDFARAPAPPTLTTQPQAPLSAAPLGPEQPGTVPAAPALPAALPPPARTGSGQAGPMPQLAIASPDAGLPRPAIAQRPEGTVPAPLPTLADPGSGLTEPPADAPAPLPPAVPSAARPAAASLGSLQTASTPAAAPESVSIALPADGKVPPAPDGWSLQTSAPPAVPEAPPAQPRAPSSASAGDRPVAAPAPEVQRPHAPIVAPGSGSPAPARDQAAADDQGWPEPSMEASGRAVARFEHAATEPARAPAPGRSAPPPPMFQVGVHIAKAVPARIDRLFVQLEPASLGRVEVRLEFHRDHQVSAVIAAERPDTLDALQRDARALERSLQQAGLRLDSDGLTFSLKREQAHEQAHEEHRFAPPAGEFGDQPLLAAPHGHEPPPVQWFRSLRALDIRV